MADRRRSSVYAIACWTLVCVGSPAAAQVAGSKHDLSKEIQRSGSQARQAIDACPFCHELMVDARPGTKGAAWSRAERPQKTVVETGSPAALEDSTEVAARELTLFCLGCHDGTIAVNMRSLDGRGTEATDDGLLWIALPIGPDLSDDHPVSVAHDPAADPELQEIAEVERSGVRLYGSRGDQVECPSCHDPHDPSIHPFLRVSNQGSDLCLICHLK